MLSLVRTVLPRHACRRNAWWWCPPQPLASSSSSSVADHGGGADACAAADAVAAAAAAASVRRRRGLEHGNEGANVDDDVHRQSERLERMARVLGERLGNVHLVVENLGEPGNGDAILRTADVLGIQHVHVIGDSSVSFGSARRRQATSRGAAQWLTITRHRDADEALRLLQQRLGLLVWASDASTPDGSGRVPIPLPELPLPLAAGGGDGAAASGVALVVGNERVGITAAMRAGADATIWIPEHGLTSSLNVSVATGIMLHTIAASARAAGWGTGLDAAERERLLRLWQRPKSIRRRASGIPSIVDDVAVAAGGGEAKAAGEAS